MDFHQSADLSIILHFFARKFFEIPEDNWNMYQRTLSIQNLFIYEEFRHEFTLTIIAFNQPAGVLSFYSDWPSQCMLKQLHYSLSVILYSLMKNLVLFSVK